VLFVNLHAALLFVEALLSHFDGQGKARMVDVGNKAPSLRKAHARAVVKLPKEAAAALLDVSRNKKGDTLAIAQIAGIMGCKHTSNLIPLCHPIPLDVCHVDLICADDGSQVVIDCVVSATNRTGVEMEALTGASTAVGSLFFVRSFIK